MATRTTNATIDSWWAKVPGTGNLGNGAGPRLQVGKASFAGVDWVNQTVISIPLSSIPNPLLTGVLQLKVRGSHGCVGVGSAPRFFVDELLETVSSNGEASECGVTAGGGSDAKYHEPITVDTTKRGKYSGTPADDSVISIDLRAMLQAKHDAGATVVRLVLRAANSDLTALEEDNGTRKIAFWSIESLSPPKIVETYNTNTAPNGPAGVGPGTSGGATVVTTDLSITVTGTFSDPDAGDTRSGTEMEVYPDSSTDGALGTRTYTSGKVAGTASAWSLKRTAAQMPGTVQGTWYRYRVRDYDAANTSGAWTSLANGRFRMVQKPAVVNTAVAPDSLNPEFNATITAGKTISAYRLRVFRRNVGGSITTMRDTGKTSVSGAPTLLQENYDDGAGVNLALSWNVAYSYRLTIWDQYDAATDETAEVFWAPIQNLGPSNMTPRLATVKQPKRAFDYRIQHGSNFTAWAARFYADPSGTSLLWNIPTQSVAATTDTGTKVYGNTAGMTGSPLTPATPSWGARIWWQAAIDTGSGLVWSGLFPVIINLLPKSPPMGFDYPGVATAVQRPDGVFVQVQTTAQIVILAAFTDPDAAAFGDVATRREDEVRNAATPIGSGSLVGGATIVTTVGVSNVKTVSSGIALESSYDVRTRFRDGNTENVDGPWGEWATVKPSRVPTATLTAPANASVVNDPTTLLDWAYASTPGKAQAFYQVVVTLTSDGSLVHDSGIIAGAATAYTLPPNLLLTGGNYTWHVTVWDTDGLSATL